MNGRKRCRTTWLQAMKALEGSSLQTELLRHKIARFVAWCNLINLIMICSAFYACAKQMFTFCIPTCSVFLPVLYSYLFWIPTCSVFVLVLDSYLFCIPTCSGFLPVLYSYLFWIPTCFFDVFILVLYCIEMYCFETLFKVPISWSGFYIFWLLKLTEVTSNNEFVLQWIHAVVDILKIQYLILNRIGIIINSWK